jgi:hypothetical protein
MADDVRPGSDGVIEHRALSILFNTFFSIPSLQYPLEGCARRVPLRGTQRSVVDIHDIHDIHGIHGIHGT